MITIFNREYPIKNEYPPENPKNPKNPNNAENGNAAVLQSSLSRSFPPILPLKPSAEQLPPFPVHCLPSPLREYVEAVAVHTQTPVDMAAGVALGVLAACLQGNIRVEGNVGHYEQTSLYVFLVAPPGSRKSAVIHAMTSVMENYEQDFNERQKPHLRKNRQEREALQRQVSRLEKQLEAKYDSMTERELQKAQDDLEELEQVHPLQLFTDDCTSEMMTRLLKDNNGRMALISAEGGAFDNIVGRYTKKPNLDVWLKGICGDTIRVDRMNREPDYIRHPALSMVISAQPSVLGEIMHNGLLDGRGFLARMLYINVSASSVPDSFLSEPIPQNVKERYEALIYSLLNIQPEEPLTLRLSSGAIEKMDALCRSTEYVLRQEHRDMREWGSKYIGLVLRIAGLLHMASGLNELNAISESTAEDAIEIGRYAFCHALYAYSILGNDETVEKALHILTKLKSVSSSFITRSELYQRCRGRFFRDAKEMENALNLLEQHGYIRLEMPAYSGTGRPSSCIVLIHPEVNREKKEAQQEWETY